MSLGFQRLEILIVFSMICPNDKKILWNLIGLMNSLRRGRETCLDGSVLLCILYNLSKLLGNE